MAKCNRYRGVQEKTNDPHTSLSTAKPECTFTKVAPAKLDHGTAAIERLFVDIFLEAHTAPPSRIVRYKPPAPRL